MGSDAWLFLPLQFLGVPGYKWHSRSQNPQPKCIQGQAWWRTPVTAAFGWLGQEGL